LHHPYDSFAPVIDLVRGAAADPNVLAIKQTLYRVGARSPIVDALIEACRAGKDVTVLVELRARFDEEANIDLATRLQDAGAKVAYGIVGYKTHAKMLLIVRREGRKLRRYVHLSTGNYHSRTAQAYTDIGLLTANHAIAEDVHGLFNQLTGLGKVRRLKRVIQSPFDLATRLVQWIDFEAEEARAGRPARIIAKMNALTEPHVIQALYRASQAGVRIDLIVRGICGLKPGIRGVSEHIHVRSVMGRFLEHARVFYFHAAGEERVYCSSADWMQRNLSRRVETCFPIEDSKAKARVFEETLRLGLADNTFAWTLGPDGTWQRSDPGRTKPLSVQTKLLRQITSLRDLELESFPRENGGFGVEVGSRQRVLPQPVAGEGQAKASARHGDAKRRKRARGPAPVQQNGETKHDREPPRQPGS
jgi:polyphosphate kinase